MARNVGPPAQLHSPRHAELRSGALRNFARIHPRDCTNRVVDCGEPARASLRRQRSRAHLPREDPGMRLTLRTLLAWLDDTLEPSQVREIGKQVSESPFAQELADR